MLSRIRCKNRAWYALGFLIIGLIVTSPVSAVETGVEPPDFKLANLDGEQVRLADFRGQTIILKLATTWCPSCKQQIKELAKLETFLIDNKITLIEVYVDEPEDTVREYLQQRKFNVPSTTLIDDGQVARAYRLYTIPRVLLIDSDFKVQRDRGVIVAGDLQKMLQKMLSE